jgi:ABC-type sulfate/molybdate transport systems ATPase subunit
MLKIENLSLELPSFSLRDNSLSIDGCKYFVLLGSSGSGKTLFLETLAGRYKDAKVNLDIQNEKVDKLVDLLQIKGLKKRYPKNLSGAEKQRVAFARALVAEPSILLLDEPMSSLDYITKKRVSSILKDVYTEYKPTVIHVTHDISEAMFFAHNIGIMNNGKIEHIFKIDDEIKQKGESFFYEYI